MSGIVDFIMFKIVLRSILASIMPILIYSIGFAIFKIFDNQGVSYFNMWSWIVIGVLALVWPFSQIGLWLIFTPILGHIRKKVRSNKLTVERPGGEREPLIPFVQRGNFAPILTEGSYRVDSFSFGEVPADISGTFLKNGPNEKWTNETERYHWFAGDGMLHGFQLCNGELTYTNRFTRTNKYVAEEKAGRKLKPTLQEFTELGVLLAPITALSMKVGFQQGFPDLKNQGANTAMLQHANRIHAVLEVDLPFQVKVDVKSQDLMDIASVGFYDYDGQLKHPLSAHPKVDKKTNELFAFCYHTGQPKCSYSVINNDGKCLINYEVPLLSPRMIHEFLITEKYAIIPDLPLEFDPPNAIKNKQFLYNFNKTKGARYGIWPRYSKDANYIKWFDVEPHFCFHYGTCYDSINENGDDIVTVYGVSWPDIDVGFQYKEHLFKKDEYARYEKFEFNMSTFKTTRTIVIDDMFLEFPNLNQYYYGYKSRYNYLCYREKDAPWPDLKNKKENDNIFYTGFLKFDTFTDSIVEKVSFGPTHTGGEVYFQQRDNSDPTMDEDDGYLINTVHNWETNKCHFCMWDAKTLKPVVVADLKERVPHAFHSTFVQEKDY